LKNLDLDQGAWKNFAAGILIDNPRMEILPRNAENVRKDNFSRLPKMQTPAWLQARRVLSVNRVSKL
jgi:hypothetical protein